MTVLIATFMPSYASFTAFRALQGFVATSPQVIGLSVVHDLFFFHGQLLLQLELRGVTDVDRTSAEGKYLGFLLPHWTIPRAFHLLLPVVQDFLAI